jgi:hypothetical protein
MHGRLHHVILDCPDPRALGRFSSALLNQPIAHASGDFVVVAANDTTSGPEFQLARDHRAPTWPEPAGHPFCLVKRPSWAQPVPD